MQLIERPTFRFKEWIRTNLIEPRNPWQRFYFLATCCAVSVLALWVLGLQNSSPWVQVLMVAFALCMVTGFICWAVPRHWDSLEWKILVGVTTTVTLPLSYVLASNAVSLAIGLPAQDFPLTVSISAGLLAIPGSMIVGSIFLMLAFLVVLSLAAMGKQLRLLATGLKGQRLSESSSMSDHAIGALVFACSLLMSVGLLLEGALSDPQATARGIRWIAYAADYMPAARYPGVGTGERVRLHENGVISTARREAAGVVINIREFTEPAKQNQTTAAAPTNPVKP